MNEVIEALAIARITRLINADRVPFGALRERVLTAADADSGGLGSASRLAELVTCPWCMSIWVAFAVVLVLRHLPGWSLVSRALAASYVTGFLAAHYE